MEEVNRQIGKLQDVVKELEKEIQSGGQHTSEALIVVKDNKVWDINDEAHDILGFTRKDLLGDSPYVLFPDDKSDGKSSREKFTKLYEKPQAKRSKGIVIQIRHKNGFFFDGKVAIKKVLDNDEIWLTIIKTSKIPKSSDLPLLRSEPFISEISEALPIMFRMSNEKNEYYYFSKQWQHFTGRSLKEEQKGAWKKSIFKEDFQKVLDALESAYKNQSKYELNYRLVRHDGEARWAFESGIPLFDSDGVFLGFLSVTVDISSIYEVETSLQDSQIKLQTFTENSPVLFRMADENNKFYYFSKQWLTFTGRSLKEELNNGWLTSVHSGDYKMVKETLEVALTNKNKYEFIYRIKNNAGEYKWILDSGMPVFTQLGVFNGFITAAIDINEQKLVDDEKSRERAFKESEKKLQESLNNSSLIAISIDANERITYCNKYFLETSGYDHNIVLGHNINDFLNIQVPGRRSGKSLGDYIAERGYPESFEAIITNAEGEKIFVDLSTVILYDESGLPSGVTIIGENTTEKKKVREALERSNAQLTDLFDNANDLIQIFQPNGKITFTNITWRVKLGYKEEEIDKLRIKDIVHPDALDETLKNLNQIAKTKKPNKFDTTFITKSGASIFLTGSVNCRFSRGRAIEFRGIFYDVTEKLKAEKSRNLFHTISSLAIHSPDLEQLFENIHSELGKVINVDNFYIALYNQDKKYINFPYYIDQKSNISPKLAGRPYGNGITEYAISHNRAFVFYEKDILALVRQKEIEVHGEIPKIWIGVPLRLNKRIVGVIAAQSYDNSKAYSKQDLDMLEFVSGQIAISIDRKQKEEKIREQAGRLESIFESSSHIIWSINTDYMLSSYNKNYTEFISEFVDEDTYYRKKKIPKGLNGINKLNFWRDKYDKVFSGKVVQFESRFLNVVDGSEAWKSIVINPIYNEDGTVGEISAIAHDITKNKYSEFALQESEEKFRDIFESFQDVYFRCDFKGEIMLLSPSIKEVLGYEPSELIGKDITNYYLYSKKTRDLLKHMILRRNVRNFDASIIDKEGKILQCICNVRLIYDHRSKKAAMEGVVRDITKMKQANIELKQAKDIAERSLKVKELFLANMSHEIRTPMNGIIGMIDLMEGTSVTEEQQNYIGTIKKSSETLLNILNDILDLSKIEAGKMELRISPVKLKSILEKLYALFAQQALSKSINLYYHLSEDLPEYIQIDETRLLQILSNLTSNAIKFTDGGGSINIGMKRANIPGKRHMIKCVVSDSGIGISHENVKKLFTSFSQLDNSTTKTFGGTGLGLAISKELCKLMGGKIGVFSTLGLGSTFWFTFQAEPTQKTVVIEDRIVDQDIKIEGYFKDECPSILLVDDNQVNRQVAGEILKKSGCKVELVDSGMLAVEKVEENDYNLVFMDIQMPEMDGVTTTKKMKELKKNIPPVVAMTAYSMKEDRERFLKQGLDDYISKPIKANDLLNKVRQWIKDDSGVSVIDTVSNMNSGEVLNMDIFTQLENLSGKEMLEQVFGDFMTESTLQIDNCKGSLESDDYDTILRELHTLKGNAGTLGAEKLSKQAEFIEDNLKKKKYDTITQDIEFLKLTFNEFQNRYKKLTKENNHD